MIDNDLMSLDGFPINLTTQIFFCTLPADRQFLPLI